MDDHSDSDGEEPADNAPADNPSAGVDNSAGAGKHGDDGNPGAEDGNLSSGKVPAAVTDGKAGNLAVDGNPAAKPGNLVANGNLAATRKTTGNAAGVNVGDANPPPEPLSRSPVISRVIFDGKIPRRRWQPSRLLEPGRHHGPDRRLGLPPQLGRGRCVHLNRPPRQDRQTVQEARGHPQEDLQSPRRRRPPCLLAKLHSILGGTDAVPQLPATIPTTAQSERHYVEKSSENLLQPAKRRRVEEVMSPSGNLARAIVDLAEAYKKVEMEKMKQAAKMGEQWMSLVKDFESEWIKFYKETKKEIKKLNNG